MKRVILKQSFKTYTMAFFFTALVSILLLPGFTHAKEKDVVEPAQSSKQSQGTASVSVPAPFSEQPGNSIPIPDVGSIEGIAWQGKYLWVLDGEKKKIDQFDPTLDKPGPVRSLDLTQALDFDLKKLKGLAFDGKALWVADEAKKTLMKINPEDGKMEKPIKMEIPVDKGFDSIEGITWDKKAKALWVAIYAGYSSSFNQIDPETGKKTRSVFADCHPRGIATDGEYLWSICYNDKKFPSKIDKRKIQDKEYEMFHSRTFVKDIPKEAEPNGLVFDDTHLWYADRETKTVIRFTPSDVKQKPAIPPVKGQ